MERCFFILKESTLNEVQDTCFLYKYQAQKSAIDQYTQPIRNDHWSVHSIYFYVCINVIIFHGWVLFSNIWESAILLVSGFYF